MKRFLLLPLLITAVSGKDGDDLKQADLAKLLDPALCPAVSAQQMGVGRIWPPEHR